MQRQLLNENVGRVRAWRSLALVLSSLALGLAGYRQLVPQQTSAVKVAAAGRSGRAAQEPQTRPFAPAPVSYEVTTEPVVTLDPVAIEQLSQRLNSDADGDVSDAANGLVTAGGPQAYAALRAATHSRRSAVREAAFAALVGVDTAETRDFMLAALNEPEPLPAVGYFSDCREPRALPALERLARSPVQELSHAALEALSLQGVRAEAALTRLLQADTELTDAMLATPPHTLGALHALRASAIARLHEGAITSGPVFDFLERDLSAESREALLFAARDPASADAACSALARRADGASLAALSQLANDNDPQLAAHASCALATDPDSRSRAPLERALHGKEQSLAARALLHINAPGARAI